MKINVLYFSTVNKSCEQKQVTVLSAAQRVPVGGKGHVTDMANGFVRSRVNVLCISSLRRDSCVSVKGY